MWTPQNRELCHTPKMRTVTGPNIGLSVEPSEREKTGLTEVRQSARKSFLSHISRKLRDIYYLILLNE